MGAEISWAPVRCAWCAPTPSAEGLVLPERSRGGAADCGLPWHAEQVPLPLPTCTTPSTWNAGLPIFWPCAAVSWWQALHSVLEGSWLAGGRPWQLPQFAEPPVQEGWVAAALVSFKVA